MNRKICLFAIFIVSIFFLVSCEKKVSEKYDYKIEYLNNTGDFIFEENHFKEIVDKSYQLLEHIKNKDTDSILEMCYDGYLMYDSMNESHITKKNLFKDFRSKGDVYSLLFDSENYYKRNRQFIDHLISDDARKDYRLCIRDVLMKYEFVIEMLQLTRIEKRVTVYYNWENKDLSQSSRIGYSTGFVYVDNQWKIKSLLDRSAY